MTKVAIVSGANKGVGLAIVRSLCKQFDGDVILTSRNVERGHAAVKLLEDEGLSPKYHQLDVTDEQSVVTLHDYIVKEYGGVDILVNNAGVMFVDLHPQTHHEKVDTTMKINYTGTLNMCKTFLPAMKQSGRLVNVSSQASQVGMGLISDRLRADLTSPDLDLQKLDAFMQEYIEKSKQGCPADYGWPAKVCTSEYMVSKMGVTLFTSLLAKKIVKEGNKNNLLLVSCCPGLVSTDLTSTLAEIPGLAKLTPDEGADTPVYLALLPPENTAQYQGLFFLERKDETDIFLKGSHPAVAFYKDGSIVPMLNNPV